MKRRNVDCVKPRRPLKRTKIGEGLYGSTFIYVKFLVVWLLVIAADFLFEFRFEYLWPFWLLLRSVYDSFRYQGLAFSILFVCMALTSDMICLLFIPVNWLFFAASTYVWVQFVWHSEKGVCMPSIVLWVLFIYIEALIRLKDVKNAPFHLDLCRPFAAHCIGYPVVTLGFGLKSYVGYRLRQRRQREVAKENEFYLQLLQEALPIELQSVNNLKSSKDKADEMNNGDLEIQTNINHTGHTHSGSCNGSLMGAVGVYTNNISSSSSSSSHSNHSSSGGPLKSRGPSKREGGGDHYPQKEDVPLQVPVPGSGGAPTKMSNGMIHIELDYTQKTAWSSSRSVNDFDESEAKDKSAKSPSPPTSSPNGNNNILSSGAEADKRKGNSALPNGPQSNGTAKFAGTHANNLKEAPFGGSASSREKKNKNKETNKEINPVSKEESVNIIRLEADVKRLKADLQGSRQTEQELRNQINTHISSEKALALEARQLQQDNDSLQNKLHNLVTARQTDRSTITSLEKKLQDERRSRQSAEAQVTQLERKNKKLEEQNQARAQALASAKTECSDSCRNRRGEIEGEVKRLRRENRSNEEKFRGLERENLTLRQYKENQSDAEVLMSALSAMQDKNAHLEASLSAETKIKLDLFSALGECKRQLAISQGQISGKEKEIEELKTKITEVLAVCPPTSSFPGNTIDVSRYYSSKILPQVTQVNASMDCSTSLPRVGESLMDSGAGLEPSLVGMPFSQRSLPPQQPISPPPHSNLDPNARVYTPKGISGSDS